jgi:osmoprotectant transport system substrate-binding protein
VSGSPERRGSRACARRRRPTGLARVVLVTAVLVVAGCAGPRAADGPTVLRVGAGPDAESLLLAETVVVLLERGDVPAEVVAFADARDSRRALELGDVALRIGYSGETWLEVLGRAEPPGDVWRSIEAVREHDLGRGIVWLVPEASVDLGTDRPPANATFVFAVAGPPSVDADLRTVSQLAARLAERPEARVCVDREFGERPDGLRAVLAAYSVRSDRPFLAADPTEAVLGVLAGECLAGLTTATDGAAWRAGLVPLVDDLAVFPAFVPLPQVRADVLAAAPGIRGALAPLVSGLTTAELARANGRVLAGVDAEDVAAELVLRLDLRAAADPA